MEERDMTNMLAVITIAVSAIGVIASAILVLKQIALMRKQMQATYDWNVRKTSQEALRDLISGEFPNWRDKIELEFGCRIPDPKENYESKTADLPPEQIKELNFILGRVLNMLEVVSINIKNNVVDEDIIYDYLGVILIEYRRWSEPFIMEISNGDARYLGSLKQYAEKWSIRFEKEQRQMAESGLVNGKGTLAR
jgi:Domain of unknown function (DUF4760)